MWRILSRSYDRLKRRVARWAVRALSTGGLDPHAGTGFWLGGRSGVNVDEQTCLTYSAVWSAVSRIAQSIASLPCVIYQPDSQAIGGGRQQAVQHPLTPLLRWMPNPEQSAMLFFETMQAHCLLWGNCFAEIEYAGGGQVLALWPLAPNRVKVERDKQTQQIIYKVRRQQGQTSSPSSTQEDVLQPWRMFHVPGLGFDGIVGYSVIRMARESIGLGMAAEQFGQAFFGNGSTTTGVLTHPGVLSPDAITRLREDWERLHRGPTNAGRVAVLEEGTTYTPISIPPDDAQFLQTRQFQVDEVARWFNIPPHLIGDLTRSTNNNIEQQGQEFVTYCLRPWMVRWEQEIFRKLFTLAEQQQQFFAEFDARELLRGAMADRFNAWGNALDHGWMNVNEVRHEENMGPVKGGETYRFPLNTTTLESQGGQGNKPAPALQA